ncbi:Flagellar assembly protein T, N-terminal domain [Desulfonauticus submarinus]|uniref:Flagellar assembly protein T, N-terminal domain n=1 Tax=Desulfonauticus submarinus TaxID=206665 RepID=A0A1H0D6U0_9BACT|nr:flagellar assembly protein T N-terminal domain-containing protein [Desulfonauticus submarinus]SDN65651.1 Flagellar assembly protein T, N-terminal domain [Desulfonauticus submarinus]
MKGRKMKLCWIIFFILFLLPMFITKNSFAIKEVVVTGMAPMMGNQAQARNQALQQALRSAVEQGIGTLIDSSTIVKNYQLLSDKIYSQASGYVKNYQVLSEGPSPDGQMYNVTIRAVVSTESIKNDLRAIGILRQQVGNPRFMTIYLPRTHSSAYRNSRAVIAAEQAIQGVFARKGFVVLDQMFVNNVYNEIEQAGRIDIDMDDLSALALKYRADLLLVYDVHVGVKKGGRSKYFGGVMVEVDLKAVAPATGDLIAQKHGDLYVRTQRVSGNYYEDMMAAKAADKVGKAVAKALIGDVLAYFERQVHGGARFDIWFRNFSEEEVYTIYDILQNISGVKDINVRQQSPGNFQVDVNYQGKKFDFQRQLYMQMKRRGIAFQTQQAKGNRFLFFKKGTDNPFRNINIQ